MWGLFTFGNINHINEFILVLGYAMIYIFLNGFYAINEVKYISQCKKYNPDYSRKDYIDHITKPMSIAILWRHFYFDLYHFAIYIEYVIWKMSQ